MATSNEAPKSSETAQSSAPEDLIGQRIAVRREAKSLNHDGLSKLTKLLDQPSGSGISRTTIRGYEIGIYKPGTRELRLLSQALEVSPNWLIFGGDDGAGEVKESDTQQISHPHNELQKFIVAATLMNRLDRNERDSVYAVLHAIGRLKLGENTYRATVMPMAELGALISDIWADMKEGKAVDQDKLQELMKAYGPKLTSMSEEAFGERLRDLVTANMPPAK